MRIFFFYKRPRFKRKEATTKKKQINLYTHVISQHFCIVQQKKDNNLYRKTFWFCNNVNWNYSMCLSFAIHRNKRIWCGRNRPLRAWNLRGQIQTL